MTAACSFARLISGIVLNADAGTALSVKFSTRGASWIELSTDAVMTHHESTLSASLSGESCISSVPFVLSTG